ncbi:MAG TPA: AAA family ATPase, partial [Gaiellaceae bacterium]|nr:AAA family ATPase [Gaiellaceae bacterium]
MTTTSSTRGGLIHAKTTIPPARPGLVRRDALIRRLLDWGDRRIVSVSAPAGYGKSTLLAQWAAEDPRPFAWIGLDKRDDDPVVLLRSVLASVERQQETEATEALAHAGRVRSWSSLLPDVVAAVSASDRPYVLVFDDVHLLSGSSLDVLGTLVRAVPDGVQLVLSGRREIIPLVARGRARGDVLELGASDLALTDEEAVELVRASGLEVADDTVAELRRRTEGWAAGLYLAVLAARASGALPLVDASVDRFVEDYLRTEHLAHVPKRQLSFLARSSVFDRMCAELCDAVLERRDSRRVIETIEQSNLFLVPLDH